MPEHRHASRVDQTTPRLRHAEPLGKSSRLAGRSVVQAMHTRAAQLNARTANRTGLPNRLKEGAEALSGIALDDVRVHRNSSRPSQLQAHAFAQGSDIHLAPGQEQHLPHETWHVVQQKQGRVRPTTQLKRGTAINDDPGLEHEADRMGSHALRAGDAYRASTSLLEASPSLLLPKNPITQRVGITGAAGLALGMVGGLIGTLVNPGLGTIVGAGIGGAIGLLGGYLYDKSRRKADTLWKLYINPKDFGEAVKLNDPGLMYDQDKSKGYQASMLKALQEELFDAELGGRIDYAEYERLHDKVTAKLKSNGVNFTTELKSIRTRSSVDPDIATSFPINDWQDGTATPPAEDLRSETINGLPMVRDFADVANLRNDKERQQQDPKPSVTAFFPEENDGTFRVRYVAEEGVEIVQAILDRYYTELEAVTSAETLEHAEDIKLTAIVKVIRALHVTHPFKDANGRLHVQLLLNRFLKEQGFGFTVMPDDTGLGVFGGAFSLPALKKMVRDGFAKAPPIPGEKPKDKRS